jgi:glycosyltransferase involved in cell wall biosynthesis
VRVLALLRRHRGGLARWLADLRRPLADQGVELVVDDATWIPDATGGLRDREVSRRLREDSKGFDVVHAAEYRAAWACAEAFGIRRPWIYTAYRLPKTTHPDFIDRLLSARRGHCVSRAVYDCLDAEDVVNLETMPPAATVPEADRAAARTALGVGEEEPAVVAMGRFEPDTGLDCLGPAMEEVWREHPQARLFLLGEGPAPPEPGDPRASVLRTWVDEPAEWLAGADLVVVPYRRAGWSRLAVEAMSLGVPVLLRASGGLTEIGVSEVSAWHFAGDEKLGPFLSELLAAPLRRESAGLAGRAWVADRLSVERNAKRLAGMYREACGLA